MLISGNEGHGPESSSPQQMNLFEHHGRDENVIGVGKLNEDENKIVHKISNVFSSATAEQVDYCVVYSFNF